MTEKIMVERVVVAVDGGPASDAALAWVIDRGRTTQISVDIITVVSVGWTRLLGTEAGHRRQHEELLRLAAHQVGEALPEATVSTSLVDGVVHEALIAASQRTDLLVVGTNKTSPVVGIMHGTVPLKVAGQAQCTTVVVPVNWTADDGPVVVGWTADTTADAALDLAAKEAARRASDLKIVHAWGAPPPTPVDGPLIGMERFISGRRSLLAQAEKRIRLAHPALTVETVFTGGSAAVAIVLSAETACLVVVGSRGRKVLAGLFLGSVSHDVLLNMPAPVAIVPKQEHVDVNPTVAEEDLA